LASGNDRHWHDAFDDPASGPVNRTSISPPARDSNSSLSVAAGGRRPVRQRKFLEGVAFVPPVGSGVVPKLAAAALFSAFPLYG